MTVFGTSRNSKTTAMMVKACAPHFMCTQMTVFGTSRNGKTTTMVVRGVITVKHTVIFL